MRFGEVVMAYFLVGAMMWGAGLIDWNEAGVAGLFIDSPEDGIATNESTAQQLERVGGPIQQAVSTVSGGGLLAAFGMVVSFFTYLFWPISVMQTVNAPIQVTVLFGGTLVVAFFVSIIRLIRSGA